MTAARSPQWQLLTLVLLLLAAAPLHATHSGPSEPIVVTVEALDAEHQSLLSMQQQPAHAGASVASREPPHPHWTPPVLSADEYLFSWQVAARSSGRSARNATQVSAVLTLTAAGSPPIVCHPRDPADLSMLCGSAAEWSPHTARYEAALEVVLSVEGERVSATAKGSFITGLSPAGWGGAEWVGLTDANDTSAQFRSVASLHEVGFRAGSDVAQATLFVAGLGGHRATVNGRALDPTSVRASVTEWSNRTFYFADDVTADLQQAAGGDGLVVVAVELYKHWYGLENRFYTKAYGPRSLKAVLVVTHANGSTVPISRTCSDAESRCSWRHGAGSTLHEDLHTGQSGDGRLATPGWESAQFDISVHLWTTPAAVTGPPGVLQPHPMQRSRVLELVRPISVAPAVVTSDNSSESSSSATTYRFTLPHEVAGFCTLVLPAGTPAGSVARIRHGEAVDMGTGLLVDVECTNSLGPNHGLHCNHMSYIARGDASGLSAHDRSWRQLALHGNTSADGKADPKAELEAFTPAFQFSAFRFVQVTYEWPASAAPVPAPSAQSLACYRIGAGFDWTGDVVVAADDEAQSDSSEGVTTPAERFNTVVVATRSTAISNYLMDVPTDCPHREKRGWTGDSLAAHSAVASFFDMRAAWTKWVDDMLYTQSMLEPKGAMSTIVPCIFVQGRCRNDPRTGGQAHPSFADVAWGSVLPLLGACTAKLTGDRRFASRAALGASAYVDLLHTYSDNASTSDLPGLLNYSNWSGHLGDWCPVVGKSSVSTLLNSHHVILDTDAVIELLEMARDDSREQPSQTELAQWALTARTSFAKAFLHNITVPGTEPPPTCGSVAEGTPLALGCPTGQTISVVYFAGYGMPAGACATGLRSNATCYLDIRSQVSAKCLGQSECSVECGTVLKKRNCAGVDVPDPCGGVHKHLSVSVGCSGDTAAQLEGDGAIIGPAFRDLYPPDPAVGPQPQTEAASGLAAMDAAPASLIGEHLRVQLGNMLVALVENHNRSSSRKVAITGGILDMAHLVPELIKHGRPDVAFDVLAADGPGTYYNMAKYGLTLWENWANANGCDTPAGCDNRDVQSSGTGVGSLNHIMYGGSVGSAVFDIGGIGGVQPHVPLGPTSSSSSSRPSERRVLSPVPWLPEAPRGSTVWRTHSGTTSTAWAAHASNDSSSWRVWVNVSVPAASSGAEVRVMLPRSTAPGDVCAWECGLSSSSSSLPSSSTMTHDTHWISFDAGGGHMELRAVAPSAVSIAKPPSAAILRESCTPIWKAGEPAGRVAGVESVGWVHDAPGRTMFPALSLAVTSGDFAIYATRSC